MEATCAGPVPVNLRRVYIVGSLSDRATPIAISSQQIRAVNLIHALIEDGVLRRGSRLCVVGAGAAGLTAAAFAMENGVAAKVVHKNKPLWNLRGCRTRWLHPNLFRKWPDDGWNSPATVLPVMNWYAGYASDVGELLWQKYQSYQSAHGAEPLEQVSAVSLDPDACAGGSPKIWYTPVNGKPTSFDCDAVVLAVGFGSEARMRDTAAGVYWLDDALERDNPHRDNTRYLISGDGDGGLTDLLRIRIADFRHHHLRDMLLDLCTAHPRLREDVMQADLPGDPATRWGRYKALAKRVSNTSWSRALRCDTSAILTSLNEFPFVGWSWRVNRFLSAMLLVHDAANTRYEPGPYAASPRVTRRSPLLEDQPEEFEVTFAGARPPELVNAIVIRHGVRSSLRPILENARLTREQIDALEEKHLGPITDEPRFDLLANHDRGKRTKRGAIHPPIAGRTLIGLLSRLVGVIGPDCLALADAQPPAATALRACGPFVTDELASVLATAGETTRADPSVWRLACEIPEESAIRAIMAIDQQGLKDIWQNTPALLEDLRQHWVLPRPSWIEPAGLLKSTVVARQWGHWQLEYVRVPGGPTRRAAIQLTRMPPEKQKAVFGTADGTERDWIELVGASPPPFLAIAVVQRPAGRPEVRVWANGNTQVLGELDEDSGELWVPDEKRKRGQSPRLLVIDLVSARVRVGFLPIITEQARRLAVELAVNFVCDINGLYGTKKWRPGDERKGDSFVLS